MKKLFLVIFLLLFTTNAYTQTVTTNYDFRIPNEGSRDWNEIISSDIISIDKIFTIISDDIQNLPGTGDMTKAVYDANEDGYIDDAAGGFGIANGFTMVSDDILSVSRDRVSTDAYLTGLTADSISTDVISADIIVLNNIYFPINDSPADNEIIKYDASLGRLAYEEDAGGTGYWSTDNDVIYPTNLGYTVSIDRIDGHIITCDILTADIISCDRLTADIISVDTISADKLLIDSLEYPTGIPNEGDILTYDVVTGKLVFSGLIPIMSNDIGLNTTHRGSDGTDHSYIDQDVTSGATPTFSATNFSDGGSNAILTTTQETYLDYNVVSTDAVLTALTSDIISCDRLTADTVSIDTISCDLLLIDSLEYPTGIPTDNYILKYDAATGKLGWEADSGTGGGTGIINLDVQSAKLVDSGKEGARIDGGNDRWMITHGGLENEFNGSAQWQFRLPTDYSSTPVLKLGFTMSSDTSGELEYDVYVMAVSSGDSIELDANNFDTVNSNTIEVGSTAGYYKEVEVALDNFDSGAAGDLIIIALSRDAASDSTTDWSETRMVQFQYSK